MKSIIGLRMVPNKEFDLECTTTSDFWKRVHKDFFFTVANKFDKFNDEFHFCELGQECKNMYHGNFK